jgi:pyridoxamine 5'-phosphate oxidase
MSGESINAVGQLPPREELNVSLDVSDLSDTWQDQLRRWLTEATEAGLAEPTGMVLATADTDGAPSTRTVLCKTIDSRGVVFYTNYTSAKSRDLRVNQRASVTFPWFALKRQVHLTGAVTQISREESEVYWTTRPRGSQLGAWASPQSTVMSSRQTLENSLDAVTRQFRETEKVPLPRHWGGWLLRPERVEFWQGRPDRMHDRLRFDRDQDGRWVVRRLAP